MLAPNAAHAKGCDGKLLQNMEDALPGVSPEQRSALLGRGMTLACPTMPPKLLEALSQMASVPQDQRAIVVLRSVSSELSMLSSMCKDPAAALQVLMVVPVNKKSKGFAYHCELGAILSAEEVPTVDPIDLVLAAALYQWMSSEGMADARKFARFMVGLDLPGQVKTLVQPSEVKAMKKAPGRMKEAR